MQSQIFPKIDDIRVNLRRFDTHACHRSELDRKLHEPSGYNQWGSLQKPFSVVLFDFRQKLNYTH